MSNITGRLRNVVRVPGGNLYGAVYGDVHGRFRDGEMITTSRVVSEDGNIVNTLYSIYEVESWKEAAP